jgi:hypothetical protein
VAERAVRITRDPHIIRGLPDVPGCRRAAAGFGQHTYAVSRDGRLLVVVPPEGDQPLPLSVVLNWKIPR